MSQVVTHNTSKFAQDFYNLHILIEQTKFLFLHRTSWNKFVVTPLRTSFFYHIYFLLNITEYASELHERRQVKSSLFSFSFKSAFGRLKFAVCTAVLFSSSTQQQLFTSLSPLKWFDFCSY